MGYRLVKFEVDPISIEGDMQSWRNSVGPTDLTDWIYQGPTDNPSSTAQKVREKFSVKIESKMHPRYFKNVYI